MKPVYAPVVVFTVRREEVVLELGLDCTNAPPKSKKNIC